MAAWKEIGLTHSVRRQLEEVTLHFYATEQWAIDAVVRFSDREEQPVLHVEQLAHKCTDCGHIGDFHTTIDFDSGPSGHGVAWAPQCRLAACPCERFAHPSVEVGGV